MSASSPLFDKNRPFRARIGERQRLNARDAQKETVFLTVDIAGSGLEYSCGDSLGVCPSNNPAQVDALLGAGAWAGDEPVLLPSGDTVTLGEGLATRFALNAPPPKLLQLLHERARVPSEKAALDGILSGLGPLEQKAWLGAHDFGEVLALAPSAKLSPQELAGQMRRLAPRLYSIASAPSRHPREIHLVVAAVRYEAGGREREGVCSTYLAGRAPVGVPGTVPVFVVPSHFAPPAEDAAPMIMVGPGTGIAPFRGFLQDRAARNATGKNWLFFGDRHRAQDFLFEDELVQWRRQGVLTELSTAWSRDQDGKVYVQDRMREHGAELWRWLESGAFFYVCGNASRMARDVDTALHELVATHGNKTPAAAADYLRQLKKDKRYQRDVY
ncbi:MAG: hypothetical protein LBD14_05345 [Puniceicoccales bacterium]|nr:hypothetical protein [Puniceicoccales bacterium]